MIFFALMLWFHGGIDYRSWGELPASMHNRIFLFDLLHLPIFSGAVLGALSLIWKVSLVTASLGLLTRTSVTVAFIFGGYVLGVPHNIGKQGHGDGILVLTMGILALSRCGDAWSIDRLIRAYRSRDPSASDARSGEYNWPIKMLWLLTAMVFLAAGITKLRMSGLGWVTSDNLSRMILQHAYGDYSSPPVDWGVRIARIKWLCNIFAGATLLFELGFSLVLISRIARSSRRSASGC